MKRSIALSIIASGSLLGAATCSFAQGEVSAIILPLDNTDTADFALDASGAERNIAFAEPGIVTISEDGAKVGRGSLTIVERARRAVFTQPLQDPQFDAWTGPIEKLSIALWVYLPAGATESEFTLLSRNYNFGTGTAGYFIFSLSSSAGLRFVATGNDPLRTGPNSAALEKGKWTHLAMVYDQGQVHFYQNGEALPTVGHPSGEVIPALESLGIKAQITGLEKLPAGAKADDIGLFLGVALSASEIRSIESKGLQDFVKEHPEFTKSR